MSKKYFTKFLPIDGEIKENDYFLNADNGQIQQFTPTDKDQGYDAQDCSDYWGDIYKKVKLFLCSRDIQVGEKFFDQKGYEYVYQPEDFDESFFESGGGYKVIGEISPQATWVKEDMTFSEEEIGYGSYKKSYRDHTKYITTEFTKEEWYNTSQESLNLNNWYKCILIKCSNCGRFH